MVLLPLVVSTVCGLVGGGILMCGVTDSRLIPTSAIMGISGPLVVLGFLRLVDLMVVVVDSVVGG